MVIKWLHEKWQNKALHLLQWYAIFDVTLTLETFIIWLDHFVLLSCHSDRPDISVMVDWALKINYLCRSGGSAQCMHCVCVTLPPAVRPNSNGIFNLLGTG